VNKQKEEIIKEKEQLENENNQLKKIIKISPQLSAN